ncbi:MAG: hypothetical protein IMF14_00570 [Proteobacteria bacterium]|nr:hypothetical protein [Pseudomonadota bacterium]
MKFLAITVFSTFLCLLSVPASASDNDDEDYILPYVEIPQPKDFSQLGETAQREDKLILLEISATDCGFCELLEEDYIKPMLRDEDYTRKLLIRKINIDNEGSIIDFDGNETTTGGFALRQKARLTPTMLFLDSHGNEVGERIVGINTLELFGGYIEASIEAGMKAIQEKN